MVVDGRRIWVNPAAAGTIVLIDHRRGVLDVARQH